MLHAPAQPLTLYLDMNVWVDLAVGCKKGDKRWKDVLANLQEAVDSGKIVVPLSTANYLELWHRRNKESREDYRKAYA